MSNPFSTIWASPFGAPPFDAIRPEHFLPAFEAAMAEHRARLDAIRSNRRAPTIANTVDAIELAGEALSRVEGVFWNLASSDSTEEMRAIEAEIAPRSAAHYAGIATDSALFSRVDQLFRTRDRLKLTAEQRQALAKMQRWFVAGGAALDDAGKARVSAIKQRLASLGTTFSQNVLKDETDWVMLLDDGDLAGLPDFLVSAAKAEAKQRGHAGKAAITLSRSSVEPFLVFSTRRDLRERAFRAWTGRGDHGATDNKPVIAETLALRAELARLLGYPSFADYKLADTMAETADAAQHLLETVWAAGKRRAMQERDGLLALARGDGVSALAPWDWRHYAERVRQRDYALDEAVLKPYFQLEQMIAAAFETATRLFGVTFTPLSNVPVYHPDVRAFDVKDRAGRHLALFYGDYFHRPGKRSGAWMSAFREQHALGKAQRPIVVNVMNFVKPAAGEPALLSHDDARTLFHEFGHALHGMLSTVRYPMLAGTSVPRDFVELPSQLYEHWLDTPDILGRFARHYQTGDALPAALLAKLKAARTFNQGFMTVEYCASALVDLAFHRMADPGGIDVAAFEAKTLAEIGMPAEITMRHRSPHFQHIFAGEGYAAGYYSYLWSEVLDADAFAAFEATGDVFHPRLSEKLLRNIYAAGHRRPPADAYRAFRGNLPDVGPLLAKRGLATTTDAFR
jgi:peptidyl-dipeptidase Dcp